MHSQHEKEIDQESNRVAGIHSDGLSVAACTSKSSNNKRNAEDAVASSASKSSPALSAPA